MPQGKTMTEEVKSLLLRFVRGTTAGAVANMTLVLAFQGRNWTDLHQWLLDLSIAGIVGAIGGLLLTLDKWSRM